MQTLGKISEYNQGLINEHLEKCKALPSAPGEARLSKIECNVRTIARLLNKPLDQLNEKDLQDLNLKMREREMKSASDYRKALKRFLALKDKKKFIDLIDSVYLKSIRDKNASKKLVNPNDFWSEEENNAYLIESQRYSPRQSAWAALWLSTAARPGELLSLQKNDLEFKQPETLVIKIREGKTGWRHIVLLGDEATGTWHYVQPYWDSLKDNQRLFDYSYTLAARIHKKICRRARISKEKPWKFYIQRKAGLTRFYNTFGLAKAASMAGHVPGSNAMKHYVAMTPQMLEQKSLAGVAMKVCPNPACNQLHEPHESHCKKCGSPLDKEKFASILQQNTEDLVETRMELLKSKIESNLLAKIDSRFLAMQKSQ